MQRVQLWRGRGAWSHMWLCCGPGGLMNALSGRWYVLGKHHGHKRAEEAQQPLIRRPQASVSPSCSPALTS